MVAILPQAQNKLSLRFQSKSGPCTTYDIGQGVVVQRYITRRLMTRNFLLIKCGPRLARPSSTRTPLVILRLRRKEAFIVVSRIRPR